MALVSVSGACSRAGKTALVETLLRALPPRTAVAVKFTTTEDVFERCPRGAPCLVCDIDVPYRIVTDPAVLDAPGTDTERMGRAGAARVVWAIAKATAARAAWRAVSARLEGVELVILEGSTIVPLAEPDLTTFVVHPFLSVARWKPTSERLLRSADTVVVNRPTRDGRDPAPEVWAEVSRLRGREDVRLADVERPLAEWAPDLCRELVRLAGRARAADGRGAVGSRR